MISLKTGFSLTLKKGNLRSEEVRRYQNLFMKEEKGRLERELQENYPFLALLLRIASLFGYKSARTMPMEWETSPFMAYRSEYERCKRDVKRAAIATSQTARG